MDYQTKPTTRKDIRKMSRFFRKIYDISETGPFPVLDALEQLPKKFPGCYFEVVEDNRMPYNTMARCVENDFGGYVVQIKERRYSLR